MVLPAPGASRPPEIGGGSIACVGGRATQVAKLPRPPPLGSRHWDPSRCRRAPGCVSGAIAALWQRQLFATAVNTPETPRPIKIAGSRASCVLHDLAAVHNAPRQSAGFCAPPWWPTSSIAPSPSPRPQSFDCSNLKWRAPWQRRLSAQWSPAPTAQSPVALPLPRMRPTFSSLARFARFAGVALRLMLRRLLGVSGWRCVWALHDSSAPRPSRSSQRKTRLRLAGVFFPAQMLPIAARCRLFGPPFQPAPGHRRRGRRSVGLGGPSGSPRRPMSTGTPADLRAASFSSATTRRTHRRLPQCCRAPICRNAENCWPPIYEARPHSRAQLGQGSRFLCSLSQRLPTFSSA